MTAPGKGTGRIVVAGANHWSGPVTTGSQQYARLFARHGWDVAYLSDPVSPFHLLRRKSWVFTREKLRVWWKGGERYEGAEPVFAYTPFTLLPIFDAPLLRSRLAVRRSLDLGVPNLVRKLASEGFGRPEILWLEHLVFEGLAERLRPATTIYRMADDPALFPGPYPPALLARLPRLLASADLVAVTAHRLREGLRGRRDGPVLYLPNGVDYHHFARPRPEPHDLAGIPHPRALYVGSIEEWFDIGLVRAAAAALPACHFVVIGPPRIPLGALRGLPNVHVLGPRPYADVPGYLAHADVALVPFQLTPAMEAVHPIKVYEYLAAGLPVVSTGWEELRRMEAPIDIAGSPAEFVAMVEAAARTSGDPGARRAYARRNSWDARFESLGRALDGLGGS